MILALDGRMGASGDMLLGALLAAGADPAVLDPVEAALDVRYDIGTTTRCGIEATDVTVLRTGTDGGRRGDDPDEHSSGDSHDRDDAPDDHGRRDDDGYNHGHEDNHRHGDGHNHGHGNGHDHSHEDGHDHGHGDDHDPGGPGEGQESHGHAEGAGPHRTFPEVVSVVESLDLPSGVAGDAIATFELLAEAEAAVHGTDPAETAFHEVGADDAIADVVGVTLLLADLAPDRVVTTPLATGGGAVEMSHGVYPVPAPAVVELAERADWSLRGGPVEAELLTPTGAAILAHTAEGVTSLPSLDVAASGYGAGDRSFTHHPNVLRVLAGETTGDLRREPVTVLETHLDDATPEALGGLQETLTDEGALDVTVLPTTMKKSRPGHLVKVVAAPGDARQVARRLAAETGTLGVREHESGHRFVADREQQTVTLAVDGDAFEVSVKVARIGTEVYDVSAEFDDALAVARATDLPVRAVLRRAEQAAREEGIGQTGDRPDP
jgi:uncharacterized protein (TIGR00299 family) protein